MNTDDLQRALRAMHRARLSASAASVLVALAGGDFMARTDVCAQTGLEPAQLTQLADRLEALGLLTSARAVADRRVRPLALTERGRECVASLVSPVYVPPPAPPHGGPLPGEVFLKEWLATLVMSGRYNSHRAAWGAWRRGTVTCAAVRRVNRRVIFVRP